MQELLNFVNKQDALVAYNIDNCGRHRMVAHVHVSKQDDCLVLNDRDKIQFTKFGIDQEGRRFWLFDDNTLDWINITILKP